MTEGLEQEREFDRRHADALKRHVERSPFHRWSGMKLTDVGRGQARVEMHLDAHHLNPGGVAHGGMIAAIVDTAIALALRAELPADTTHRTAQLNVHFLAKAEGGRLVATGRAHHRGRRMGYGEGEVQDESGRVVARASATFIMLPEPGGR